MSALSPFLKSAWSSTIAICLVLLIRNIQYNVSTLTQNAFNGSGASGKHCPLSDILQAKTFMSNISSVKPNAVVLNAYPYKVFSKLQPDYHLRRLRMLQYILNALLNNPEYNHFF